MGKATLFILGLNHRTAPVAVRERLAYAEAEIPQALAITPSAPYNAPVIACDVSTLPATTAAG